MAAELPVRVQPVAGATVVDFPWADAATAVSALTDAITTLGSQLETRATLLPSITDWVGKYRDEFNLADGRLLTTATGLRETLTSLASSIVGGAENANQEQRQHNTAAEQRATTTTTTTTSPAPSVPAGGRVPI